MGLFDSIKNVFGSSSEANADVTVSPSQMLRDAGIDPDGLKMSFGGDGSITVGGHIADEADRQKIIDVLSTAPGVKRVDDQMSVAPAEPAAPAATPEPAPAPDVAAPGAAEPEVAPAEAAKPPADAPSEGGRTYTVQSGDTLWKISEEVYGNGSKYMKIFEANTGLLEHPDRIFPGQELNIPDLDD